MKKITRLALTIAVMLVIVIAVAELGLRGYERLILEVPAQPAPASSGVVYQKSNHPGRFYALTPNAHMVRDGISIRINAMGMRDDEPPLYETIRGKKVLVLGDSVAFGFGIPMHDAFPQLLERGLSAAAKARGEDTPVVFNAAVNGYSLRQELATLYEIGFDLKPDLIVIAYVLNDPATEQDGGLVRYFRDELLLQRYLRIARERLQELSLGSDLPQEFHQRIHAAHKAEIQADLEGVREVAKRLDAQVILLVSPLFCFSPGEPYAWRNIDLDMKSLSEALGIHFVDVWPQFSDLDSDDVQFDYLHPNSRGHALIAEPLLRKSVDILYGTRAAPSDAPVATVH